MSRIAFCLGLLSSFAFWRGTSQWPSTSLCESHIARAHSSELGSTHNANTFKPANAPTRINRPFELMDQQIHHGLRHLYNMEFVESERTFDSIIREAPMHPAGYFYRATTLYWRMVSDPDDTSLDSQFRDWLQEAINLSDTLLAEDTKDITGLAYKSAALGLRARTFGLRTPTHRSFKTILDDVMASDRCLSELEKTIPSNVDVIFGRGLFDYYIEAIKEDYPADFREVQAIPVGNKHLGLLLLEYAAEDSGYAQCEAEYELLRINYLYEHNFDRGTQLANKLVNKYPNNAQFLHYLAFCAISAQQAQRYDSVYRVILGRCHEKREGYGIRQAREAMHFIGQAELFLPKGNPDSALYYLSNADSLTRKLSPGGEDWWLVREELLMGEAYDARGSRSNALEQYNRVLKLKDISNSQTDARAFIAKPYKR